MNSRPQYNNFSLLIDKINNTHNVLLSNTSAVINLNLTFRNWLIGYYIAEYELNGEDRAKYGEELISAIAKQLNHIKGLSVRQLYNFKVFYLTYPNFLKAIAGNVQINQSEDFGILQTVSAKSFALSLKEENAVINHPSTDNFSIAPEVLLSHLSFSHFLALTRVTDPLKRLFYEVEAIKNSWSLKTLERAINTLLCERTSLSTNKQAIIAKIKDIKPESNVEVIKNPFVLEFLGLQEKSEYTESDLEQSIITHLQHFLMELGRGFCFEARQKRITFDNKHYFIDLVFYHRILKCHVLIDLKIGEFTHADAGQMTLYLNYFKAEEMAEGDNPPIGIILCAHKNDTLVKYATGSMDEQMFVSKYMLNLPKQQELEAFIKSEMQ